jgi:hypothetical protein
VEKELILRKNEELNYVVEHFVVVVVLLEFTCLPGQGKHLHKN